MKTELQKPETLETKRNNHAMNYVMEPENTNPIPYLGAGSKPLNMMKKRRAMLLAFGLLLAFSHTILGQSNTHYGGGAGNDGDSNSFFGNQAGYNTTGDYNTGSGKRALLKNEGGSYNTAYGFQTLNKNTEGNNNTANGTYALRWNTTGSNNVGLGYESGYNNQTGSGNVFLGYKAGYTETGSNKLYIANNGGTPLIYGDFATGYVGIGTTLPNEMLHVNGSIEVTGSIKFANGTTVSSADQIPAGFATSVSSSVDAVVTADNNIDGQGKISLRTGNTARLTVLNDGNVGIGTTAPDAKLTVAGDVHSQEVRVTINAGADFVFEEDYNLPALEKVEMYIKTHKHLPGIAPANEMENEGLELGEMNIKLLQKIEELTLYMIQQQKEIENLKKIVKQ